MSSGVGVESTTTNAAESAAPSAVEPREIVVFWVRRDTRCSECAEELARGSLLRREGDGVLCLKCADLDAVAQRERG